MEPLGGGWRASVHYSRPNIVRSRLDRLRAVRGDRFLDAYSREAERRRAAGRFDLPLAMAFSLLLHGAIFLMPFPASNPRTAGIPDETLLPEHRMVFLSLGGAPREAEPAPASMPDVAETAEPERAAADAAVAAKEAETEAAVEAASPPAEMAPPAERAAAAEALPASMEASPTTATIPADAPLTAAATIPPDTTTEESASPLAEVAPAAVEAEAASLPPEIVTAAAPAAEAAASPTLARIEAQPAASSAAQPIAAKPAPTAAFKPAAAAAALLARPGAPSAIAREAAGAAASAAALSAARAGTAVPATAQPAPIAAAATPVPAIVAAPEPEPPAFLAAAPLGVASGFFSPRAERIGDAARSADPGAPRIAAPADPPNSTDALFADGQAGAPPSEAGNSMGRMALGASQAVSSGAAIAASKREAVDDKAERQARTFSAAIRKSLLPQGAAPAAVPASVPASAPVSGSASARSEPFPAPAIQPQPPFEAPIAAATDIPAEAALSQIAQTAQTALQAPASLAEAQAPSPAVPPAAIAETVAAAPAAASPSEVLEFPARAAPAAVEQTVPAQAASVVPGPQEVLDLLSSLVAGRKAYPEAARRRKAQGSVGIALKVAADGSLAAAGIEKKSGSAILDRAALDLVKGLFPIALRPGEPMEIALSIEYRLVP